MARETQHKRNTSRNDTNERPGGRLSGFVSGLQSVPSRFMQPRLVLIVAVSLLLAFGLLMVFSASSVMAQSAGETPAYYAIRQFVFVAVGVLLAAGIARADYHVWTGRLLPILWVLSTGLLVLTLALGAMSHGAQRWITVIPGILTIQPSEFAKPVVVLTAANIAQRLLDDGDIDMDRAVLLAAVGVALPLGLILLQPDKGSTMIVFATIGVMLYMAGFPGRYLAALLLVGILGVAVLSLKDEYSRARILTMIDPFRDPLGAGYQLIQGFYAFGNGGLFGTGIGLSRQKYAYLPEAHNDLIFAIVGEELGFLGTAGVVLAFAVIVWAGMKIASHAPDLAGRLAAAGCTTLIAVQFLVNTCGVLGLIPLTGKPLPFLSYGGSAVMSTLITTGIIISVSRGSALPQTEHDVRRSSLRLAQEEDEGFEEVAPLSERRGGLRLVDSARNYPDGSPYRRIDLGPGPEDRLRGGGSGSTRRRRRRR